MCDILLLLLFLSSGSVLFANFGEKFERILPITTGFIVVWLYVFYILNILNVGWILLIVITICIYIFSIYKYLKKPKEERKRILKNFLTPSFIVYLILIIIIFFITKETKVLLWDELRLWGAYPKILFFDGSLQIGANKLLLTTMQSYEPGMPLFQYSVLKVFGEFHENYLVFAYSLLAISALLPICKKITWKSWPLIIVYVYIILIVPLTFANSQHDALLYYKSLYIDPMIGIYFGYTLYLSSKKIYTDKVTLINFILSLLVLTLLKDTGILFAAISGIVAVVNEIFINKDLRKKYKKVDFKYLILLLLPLILVVGIFCSWKAIQKVYNLENLYVSKTSKVDVKNFFTNPTDLQKSIMSDFNKAINEDVIVKSGTDELNKYLTYKNIIIVMIIIFATILIILKDKRKKYGGSILGFLIGNAIFLCGLLILYVLSLKVVTCFPRYISTVLLAGVILILYICNDEIKNRRIMYLTEVLICIVIVFFPINNGNQEDLYLKGIEAETMKYSKKIESVLKKEEDAKIVLVFNDNIRENLTYTIYEHQIYFDLIDENQTFLKCLFVDGSKEGNKKLEKDLMNYDYVYFIKNDDKDIELFNEITKMNNSTLYEILNDNTAVKLKEVVN